MEYTSFIQPATGIDEETWWDMSIDEELVACGAFELLDTVTCTFTTSLPTLAKLSSFDGTRYSREGYTIVIDSLRITFQQTDYMFHLEFDEPIGEDEAD